MYPGAYSQAICVGSSNKKNKVSAFSSRGWDVDVCAPGERIITTHLNNGYSQVTGSSFAAPCVSGIAACLLSGGIKITHEMLENTSIDIEEEGVDPESGMVSYHQWVVYILTIRWELQAILTLKRHDRRTNGSDCF